MVRLERLRADHEEALLAFESENREYFAQTVPDRGDDYFAHFTARLRALLDEQDAGICHFHVIRDQEGTLVGRINLMDVAAGRAELGYRVAQRSAGKGVATAAVREICRTVGPSYGLHSLTAKTTEDNKASRTVLERNGFVLTERITLMGRSGVRYARVHPGHRQSG
ncbi:ribosomal-protein-alanine N-acetyltransferase [Streptomyces sp. TLI_55]|uniref:GNAT family N-acetyltransferase n=1 Tax=Streptomyces sp. TLI_55 TaxID=1938861 RepID=UPI000BD1128E|nr:GNAT family N-acetyltransferase [Streptomyces sp. TLI_55]SNX61757.1 ribosomal-protein-alanine N-acetyltransferase [Streptomyces sp. TLI_55]